MTRSIFYLVLTLIIPFYSSAHENLFSLEKDFVDRFVNAVAQNDKQAVAQMVEYPLRRIYPLRNITNETEFIDYYDILFNDSIRSLIISSTYDDWEEVGWRGTMFRNGDIWIIPSDGGYRLFKINTDSPIERKMALESIEIESKLAAFQDSDQVPIDCLLTQDSSVLIHVSINTRESCYYATFYYLKPDANMPLNQSPSITLPCKKEDGGTCRNDIYVAEYDGYNIAFWNADCNGYEVDERAYGLHITEFDANHEKGSFFDVLSQLKPNGADWPGLFYAMPIYFQDWAYLNIQF